MTTYCITGTLGNGKTLCAVDRIRSYLWKGRRVATNLDLTLEKMLPSKNRTAQVVRLPDRPTAADLDALGLGCDVLDESRYGLLVFDELATWLNSRSWDDPGRKALLDWLVHSRKRRWDVIFLIQHIESLDKQVRQMLVEYHVKVMRFDKVKIPLLSTIGGLLTLGLWDGSLPKLHVGAVIYLPGSSAAHQLVTDRWIFKGTDLYEAYDTEQVISDSYAHGPFSYLPPWHVSGRYQPLQGWELIRAWIRGQLPEQQPKRAGLKPAQRLDPLMTLPPEVRWRVARDLVRCGTL